MTETAAPQLLTADEVAARLKVTPWWVRSKTKPVKDADGNIVKPALVTPLRMSSSRNAKLRFTEQHVLTLQAAMTAPELPPDRRRRKRRRGT